MNALDWALRYLEHGWNALPVWPKGKFPCVSGWRQHQHRRASPDEIQAWFSGRPYAGVGIVTGKISGIVVLDVNGPVGDASLHKLTETMPPTVIAQSGKGLHYLFPAPWNIPTQSRRSLPWP